MSLPIQGYLPSIDNVFCLFRVQQWAVSFGKEITALSARYSGAKLLQKVRDSSSMKLHFY